MGFARTALAMLAALLLFAACDGGPDVVQSTNSGVQSTPPPTGSTPPPSSSPPPPSSSLTISGQPSTSVAVGSTYSFTPTTNATGDDVSFQISNTPPWAVFHAATGTLVGTPTASNVGTYEDIVITVSNGSASASLSPFAIQVAPAATKSTGSVTLAWNPPTENTDGTSLTDLVGYRIYYGTDAAALNQFVPVTDSTSTSFSIGGLASGTWYFAIQAVTAVGTESALSNVASATIS